ncbi:MAG: HAD family hydrolase [Hyphomicrobiales bacterium]|nr:HAD family hydrolase [Hyphomicrobiales bacterium]
MAEGDMHRVRVTATPRRSCPALFLDRDGTLVDDPGYMSDPDQIVVLPGALPALHRFRSAGFALVLVTNQSGIGRGFFGWDDYDKVAARLRQHLAEQELDFDAECACGHAPDTGATCGWRKPSPGMLEEAARRLDLDLSASVMVGDKASDVWAADAAGVDRAVHVLTGAGSRERVDHSDWQLSVSLDMIDDLSALLP